MTYSPPPGSDPLIAELAAELIQRRRQIEDLQSQLQRRTVEVAMLEAVVAARNQQIDEYLADGKVLIAELNRLAVNDAERLGLANASMALFRAPLTVVERWIGLGMVP